MQLAVAHAHLRGRDAFRKIVVVGCMSHACVGKTEKVRVAEVSDSQQRIDFFSFFSYIDFILTVSTFRGCFPIFSINFS